MKDRVKLFFNSIAILCGIAIMGIVLSIRMMVERFKSVLPV